MNKEKTTVKSVGEFKVNLHQERAELAVKWETATITRVITYVENGKEYTRTISVAVHSKTKSHPKTYQDILIGYEINWSAMGDVPTAWATAYAELLIKAVEVAEKLTQAYVK